MKSMYKRPQKSSGSSYVTKEDATRLEKKMDRLELPREEVYRFTKRKAIGAHIKDVDIPIQKSGECSKVGASSVSEDEGGDVPLAKDPQEATMSRIGARVDIITTGIVDILQGLNVPLDVLEDRIELNGETVRASPKSEREVDLEVGEVEGTKVSWSSDSEHDFH